MFYSSGCCNKDSWLSGQKWVIQLCSQNMGTSIWWAKEKIFPPLP
uniref:Uncharacterized protein n=1 Tax=Rhizophora mucronata TaxID=61149 RepID=A0A2P2NAM9_RHIMU